MHEVIIIGLVKSKGKHNAINLPSATALAYRGTGISPNTIYSCRKWPFSPAWPGALFRRHVVIVSVWDDWTACTKTCGGGSQQRVQMCGNFMCGKVVVLCHNSVCDGESP